MVGRNRFRRDAAAKAVLLVGFWAQLVHATMYVSDVAHKVNDRFYVGGDKAFIAAGYDCSGVGQTDGEVVDRAWWGTMVSDSYFLSCYHNNYHPHTGDTLTFYHGNSTVSYETRVVAGGQRIGGTDLWLGQLTAPVSSSVAKYAIPTSPNNDDFLGRDVINFGLTENYDSATDTSQRVGWNVLTDVTTLSDVEAGGDTTQECALFDFDAPGVNSETYLQVGDSGGPTFVDVNGDLALLGIHWSISRRTPTPDDGDFSIDSFVPAYVPGINAAMSGESLTLVEIPEPASGLAALFLTAFLCRGRPRRR